MFKKKRYDNIVEYKLFGKTIAKKEVYPYGYRIFIKNASIYKKIKIEKLLAHHEAQIAQRIKVHVSQTQDHTEQALGEQVSSLSQYNQHLSQYNQQLFQDRTWYEIELDKLNKKINILNSVQSIHQETFKPYKNKYNGRDVVVVATGPTLKAYQPLPDAIHIGVNNAYKYPHALLDFLFIQDMHGLQSQINDINDYAQGKCQKFYGDVLHCDHCAISESDVIKSGAKRYYSGGMASPFLHDIASCFMPDFGSVVFPALAYALYTNPKRLYLVGCDCSDLGYFDRDEPGVSPSLKHDMPKILGGWKAFKQFAEHFYPDTEIISVNPVGLKGMFQETDYCLIEKSQ